MDDYDDCDGRLVASRYAFDRFMQRLALVVLTLMGLASLAIIWFCFDNLKGLFK